MDGSGKLCHVSTQDDNEHSVVFKALSFRSSAFVTPELCDEVNQGPETKYCHLIHFFKILSAPSVKPEFRNEVQLQGLSLQLYV